jgi:colicin import membrane protein
MASLFKKHPVAVILSVLFHAGLIAFFIFGFELFDEPVESKPPVNIVKATVIDDSKVRAEANKLKELEKKKKRDEQKRLEKLKNDQLKEEKKLDELKKQQLDQSKKIKDQKVAEAARLAKLKKQQAEQAKKKAADDKQKKAELAKKKALDKKKKAQAAKQKKANEAEKKRIEQQKADFAEMMAAANQEENDRNDEKAISSYSQQIQLKVSNSWIEPAFDFENLKCVVRVQLFPDGGVVDAIVVQGSGNALFDLSVQRATMRAAPLPVPDDSALFNKMRHIEFIFDPNKR